MMEFKRGGNETIPPHDEVLPPKLLDIVFELDSQRAIVERIRHPTVDGGAVHKYLQQGPKPTNERDLG
jgi:hypothetical protein